MESKKNSVMKNIGIAFAAWVRRYPSVLVILPVCLAVKIATPFITTLIPSLAVNAISNGDARRFVILIVAALSVFWLLNAVGNLTESYAEMQRIYTRLGHFTAAFAHKVFTTDYQNVEPQKKQKLMGKAANSLGSNWVGVENLMRQSTELFVLLFGILVYGSAVLLLDWKILCVTLLMFVCDVLLRTYAIKYSDAHREESSEIWRKKNYIKQKSFNVSAGKDIRIYQLGTWFSSLFDQIIASRRALQSKIELRWYFPTVSDGILNLARDILAYIILIKKVLDGDMTPATFTLYLGIISGFTNWIYGLSDRFSQLRKASHEFNDYFDYMNLEDRQRHTAEEATPAGTAGGATGVVASASTTLPAGATSSEGGTTSPATGTASRTSAPQITFKNVSFTYPDSDTPTLQDLSFTISAGEKIALVGNNGAGKTTIVKLLTGLYEQTEGEILVDGKSISEIRLDAFQDTVSVLFQDTNPMAFTIEENVSGTTAELTDSARLQDALKKSGLFEKVESLSQKEKTFITQNFSDQGVLLSGGETQKLLLAKAIYKDGSFLVLDEPTSALDPIAESRIYEEYNSLAGGKTAVFISHRLASTRFCDRIFFLDGGKIAEAGTHEELMKKGGKYKEMFDIQSQYYK